MCPICKNRDVQFEYDLYDDRYGYPSKYQLYKCRFCNHQFLKNEFSPEDLIDLYSKYYPRSQFKVERYRPHEHKEGVKAWFDGVYSSAFRWVPRNVRILDIGCGFCETIGYHQNRGCEAYGVEADENARRVADRYHFNVKIGLFDPNDYEPSFFDYVTLDQVIEHVLDPIQTLNGIARILKPGGKVILSTPNAKGWGSKIFRELWINWHIPYHLQFFSKSSIKIAANMAGLDLEHYKTITNPNWLHYQLIHLISHPENGIPSKFWNNTGSYNSYQKLFIKIFDNLNFLKTYHLLTKGMDLFNMGDNLLITLANK